ncbi:MAG: C17 cyclopropane fatty acid synthase CfaB [Gammaproteobacteria bacterium]|nr:MAG: C17 cyclopropane fatty acid synthase CfaB [Gammaproteobacteria bacterium]
MIFSEKKLEPLVDTAWPGSSAGMPTKNNTKLGTEIISTIMTGYSGPVAIRLWDGTLAHGTSRSPCTLIFRSPATLRDLLLHRNLLRLVDSYLTSEIDVEGELEFLFDLRMHLSSLDLSLGTRLSLMFKALRLPGQHRNGSIKKWRAKLAAHRNSKASISHHYDVSNEFYRLWLDPEMVYSCAYFHDEQQSLADAQTDKMDILCRKLRLQPGQTLLDIGCGWGALAIHAARHYGVTVHGITLSKEQQKFAENRVQDESLEQQIKIELRDYRDLPDEGRYDRVVSVGMFEHIGIKNFPTYFNKVKSVLKPNGLFLNHGITSDTGWEHSPLTRFMNRYIFPDGELARISTVVEAMENAGFETLDAECLRRHYALTLRKWVTNLEQHREQAIHHSSEVTYRLWRLYMAGCAYYFDEGEIGLYQVLVGHRNQEQPVPLRRDDIYTHDKEGIGLYS